jgi:histidine ammonia-lyase
MKTLFLGVEGMTLENLIAIVRNGAQVQLTADAEKQVQKSRHLIERWVQDEKRIYGITTGFGALSDVAISKGDTRQLQKNILMSHSAGVGKPFDEGLKIWQGAIPVFGCQPSSIWWPF